MLHHAILLFWRNAFRQKGYFIINIAGLAIGLAAALFTYLWVYDEIAIDGFHEKDARLYQVMRRLAHEEGDVEIFHNNSDLLAPALKEEMPEIEDIVPVSAFDLTGVMSAEDKRIKVAGRFAGPDFFKIFSYNLIEGNEATVLRDKYAIVISDEVATKFFGTTSGLTGRHISFDNSRYGDTYIISGVFRQTRLNSEPFDFLGTYEMLRSRNSMNVHWDSNTVHTYITLREGSDPAAFDVNIRDFVRKKFETAYGKENLKWVGQLFLRRFSDRYLYNAYDNGVQSGGRIDYVILFSVIGIAILLIACINFMNLATARASRRMKEIGIKKTVGASQRSLAFQHLIESLVTSGLALVGSVVIIALVLSSFNSISGKHLVGTINVPVVLGAILITLATGLIAGSYPAFYLSAFRPVEVLKGKLATTFGEVMVRQGLVIFQFCISTLLIMAVWLVNRQVDFVQTKHLGYNRANVITFETEGALRDQSRPLLLEIRNIPGVRRASNMGGNLKGNYGGGGGVEWEGKDHRIEFAALYVNFDLMEALDMKMAEGRMFSPEFIADSTKVIFNETAIRQMNLKEPIGRTVKLWGQESQIIGVVKDFHFESLYDEVKPFMFRYSRKGENVIIKIEPGREQEVIAKVEKVYAQFNPGIPFSYKFLDDDYASLYAAEQRVGKLSSYFAGIAIFTSILGLVALVWFGTERRRKEIGIRKVLGAPESSIVLLLSRDFLKLVIVASAIAVPVGYIVAQRWLEAFAFSVELTWWYFLVPGIAMLAIAWIAIGPLALRAARVNPASTLQSE